MRPPYLKKGDKIGILSTARKISAADLLPAIHDLKSWGLEVVTGRTITQALNQFAGDDELRLSDFQEMLDDPSIKAILCARGGYGTVRIIDRIDFSNFIKTPKWIAGFSDITVLHSHIAKNYGIPTIHCLMPAVWKNATQAAIISLRNALFGHTEELNISISQDEPLNREGTAEGILTGGNASILYSLTGTASDCDTSGKILFLEDLDEYLYHIDRMFFNFKRSGKLAEIKGLLIGGMTEMKDNEVPFGETAEQIIARHVSDYDYPVCFHFPAGHIEDNRALVLGGKINIKITKHDFELTYKM